LATLEPFLKACLQLKEKVKVRTILESMIERLTNQILTATPSESNSSDSTAFTMFDNCVTSLIEGRPNMPLIESLRLETLLVSFALKCFPNRMDYVSHCLYASSLFVAKTDFRSKCEANKPEEMETVNGTVDKYIYVCTYIYMYESNIFICTYIFI
jgi:hypothetical protein